MVILITGASHTGKTALAQRMLESYGFPYLSMDHLKMGLIKSGHTNLTPLSPDPELTAFLWPVVREMVKTAVENGQNLIVEGCYIPRDWHRDFSEKYRKDIRCFCLVMTEGYIRSHFDDIRSYANVVETRMDDSDLTVESLIRNNAAYLDFAETGYTECIRIDREYRFELPI